MENTAYIYKIDEIFTDWHECYISESKNTGMVATLDLSKIAFNEPKTFWWTYESLGKLLSITERERPYKNVYLSLNAFKQINGTIRRKATHLSQIRNAGIDLDCYKLGITPDECKKQLFDMIAHSKIPNPNLVINSGNGVQLIYSIGGGLAPTNELKWLVMYLTRELSSKLIHLGADFQTCTLERVFRLPGTLNKKEGYPTKLVTAEVWNKRHFTLTELLEYVPDHKKSKKKSKFRTVTPLRNFKKGMRTLPQMNMARANDLLNLVHLRGGQIENRNILCYDYAFSLALGSDMTRTEIHAAVAQMDAAFSTQQKKSVLRRTVKSAIDGAEMFWRAYFENEFSMIGLDKNLVKPKKTTTIIEQHSITAAEMEMLEVICDKKEKDRRYAEKRYNEGMQTMEQYNAKRAEKVDDIKQRVIELKATGMKQKDIATELGISKGRVSQLLKKV